MNPLQQYFRQPKIYFPLPSKGKFYPAGVLACDPTNVPVYAMNGMDEILMKTPDALFSGESTIKVIESCCPGIKDAGSVPGVDVESLIIAIRIASIGNTLTIGHTCSNPECKEETEFEVNLNELLDYFASLEFKESITVLNGEVEVFVRPLSYREISALSIKNYQMQKKLQQIASLEADQQPQAVEEIYRITAETQLQLVKDSIVSVKTPAGVVYDPEYIAEWITNCGSEVFNAIKQALEENKKTWAVPPKSIVCPECSKPDTLSVILDQSNFFG